VQNEKLSRKEGGLKKNGAQCVARLGEKLRGKGPDGLKLGERTKGPRGGDKIS